MGRYFVLSLGILIVLLGSMGCIGEVLPAAGGSDGSVSAPVVSSFGASPETISPGGTSQLAWSASNATSLSIDQGVGDVTSKSSVTVTPAVTTTYTLSATGPGGTRTATATVTVSSSTAAPAIASFTATPSTIASGASSALAWSASNATSLSIDQGLGNVTGRSSVTVTPAVTTTYTLSATGPGGTRTATATVTVISSADATLVIDATQGRQAISPYVYGYNPPNAGTAAWTPSSTSAPSGTTLWREGGNRTTAYNWTNNYSNAGNDWFFYNDRYFGSPADGPGHAVVPMINYAKTAGIAAMVTIPIQGWVSKAEDLDVKVDIASPLTEHFIPNKAKKGSAFTTNPSSSSTEVYQDEFAHFVAQTWGSGNEVHLSLDNEPDLWFSTHKEVQRAQPTYASYLATWVESSTAIKAAVPGAILYGPANYGWWGYVNFSGATDAPPNTGPDFMFLDWFLAQVNTASAQNGKRLLDVLDLHFYSEAQSTGCSGSSGDGVRVVTWSEDPNYAKRNDDCVAAARVQSARSLGDPTYIESSGLTRDSTKYSSLGQAINLVPRIRAKIAAAYPGTKLSISEYNFGGGDHISGAVAQADALGILGREGAYAAMLWEMLSDSSWIRAAFRAYRNYDGAGKNFGDTSVSATSSDMDHVGVYASLDARDGRLVLVIVHRPTLSNGTLDSRSRTVRIQWTSSRTLGTARAWQLTGSSSTPTWIALTAPTVDENSVTLALPGMSVTTLELTP